MSKHLQLVVFALFFTRFLLYGQDTSAFKKLELKVDQMGKDVSSLQTQLLDLRTKNRNQSEQIFNASKDVWEEQWRTFSNAIDISDELSTRFSNLSSQIVINRALVSVASGQNISTTKFGKLISEAALNMYPKADSSKVGEKRWKKVVSGIINNEFVGSIIKSNPVTSCIAQIINYATTYSQRRITKNKDAKGNIVYGEQNDEVESNEIELFKDRMVPIIDYFEKLNKVNDKFDFALSSLALKNMSLKDSIVAYNATFNKILNAPSSGKNRLELAEKIFKRQEHPNFETEPNFYNNLLKNESIIKLVKHAGNSESYRFATNVFENEYKQYFVTKLSAGRAKNILIKKGKSLCLWCES